MCNKNTVKEKGLLSEGVGWMHPEHGYVAQKNAEVSW
jgi:hypothetical protein